MRQFAREGDVGDPFDQGGFVHHVRDACDVDHLRAAGLRSHLPGGAQADGARACFVDVPNLCRGVENLAAGRKVGRLDVFAELRGRHLQTAVDHLDEGRAHLAEMVRRDVGGHTDRDARGAVDEQVRQSCRQHDGFLAGAVVVGPEVNRVLVDFLEDFVADACEPTLRVAHRRRVVAVERPEVSRAVDQRIPQRKRLRHSDERFIQSRVAVRVVVAHHVADDLGALAMFGVGRQVLLPHRVEDAALDGFQPVTHVGQRA